MPVAFDRCVRSGGRVRTVSGPSKKHDLKKGEYRKYCFKDGKSYRGEKHKAEFSPVAEAARRRG